MSPTLLSRTQGALLALHAGDSLGATYEFEPHEHIKSDHPTHTSFPRSILGGGVFNWTPGAATDDTDLTRAVLLAYRDLYNNEDTAVDREATGADETTPRKSTQEATRTIPDDESPNTFPAQNKQKDIVLLSAEYFLSWYTGNWPLRTPPSHPIDIGGATDNSLSRLSQTHNPSTSGDGPGSAGNGSLMRCLPTGLFQLDGKKLVDESLRISAVTHDDVRCTISCASYNTMVNGLVHHGLSPGEAVKIGEDVAAGLEGGDLVVEAIRLGREISLVDVANEGPSEDHFPGDCGGYVLESLTLAVAAVLDERSLVDVLIDVVRVGSDTDTNAAIAGGLLGARDGVDAVPKEWRDMLQFGQEFMQIAEAMIKPKKK